MLQNLLNKNERKLFSKRSLNKIKKHDFFSYLEMQEALLVSLQERYDKDNVENHIAKLEIKKQQELVDRLNIYYYDVVLLNKKTLDPEEKIVKEFNVLLQPFRKIQK